MLHSERADRSSHLTFEIVEQIPDYIEVRLAGAVTGEDYERLWATHARHLLVDLSGLTASTLRARGAIEPPGSHRDEHIALFAPGTRPFTAAQQVSLSFGQCARIDIFVNREEALFWLAHDTRQT